MWDAFTTTLRVGAEGAVAFALLATLVRGTRLARLRVPLAAAVLLGLAVGAAMLLAARGRGLALADVAPALHRARHLGAVALLALALLARGSTVESLAAGRARLAAELAALAAAVWVLLPEGAFLAARLDDLALLAGSKATVGLGVALGLAGAAALAIALAALAARLRVGAALTPSGTLALLLGLELWGLAATAVDAHLLPLALTGAVSRAVHDAVHLVFVVLAVPDHAFLEDRVYQLILKFLEPALHAALAAIVLAAPVLAAWRRFVRRPAPAQAPGARPPDARLARAVFRRATWAGAAPFALALALCATALWAARGGEDELYDPAPQPVVDDGAGTVIVPLATGPFSGSPDRMRKWVYASGARSITFFTVRRSDGVLAVALDLCEICQPRGYAQMGAGHVFCKYCKTPIPVDTVGQPGGCNPIPIPGAEVKGAVLLVPRAILVAAFEKGMVNKG